MWDGVIEPTLLPNPRLNLTLIETHYHEWVNHYHTLHLNVNIRNRKILQLCSSYSLQVYFKLSWSHLSLPKSFSDNPASGTTAQFFTSHKEALSMALSVTNPSVFLAQSNSDGCRVGENNSPPPPPPTAAPRPKWPFTSPLIMVVVEGIERKRKKRNVLVAVSNRFFLSPQQNTLITA